MKLAIATLATAWVVSVFSAQATKRPSTEVPANGDPGVWRQFVANEPKGPPGIWWQFVTNGPEGERQVSPHFTNEEDCERALKAVQTLLAKKFPDRYPLVGSCESYR